jgi:N-acetylglucosamine-6-sulfatase
MDRLLMPKSLRAAAVVAGLLLALPSAGMLDSGACASEPETARAPTRSRPGCAPRGRPNFVFIFADDLDAGSLRYMPRTRRLLGGCGATFRNMFVTNPICCPSSVSILTGRYSRNHQIVHNTPPLGGFQKFKDLGGESSTLATWLHDAGYYTGRLGKYLVGYPLGTTYVPPGWDEWHCSYDGFSPYFNYALNENGVVVPYGAGEDDYITDVLARRAVEFLADAEAIDDRPFFLFLAPTAPHSGVARNGPPTPAPRHLGKFAGISAPRPPSFNEADMSDKPPGIRDLPPLTAAQVAAIDLEYQARIEALQSVDEAVEQVIDALDVLGELEDTYVIFTADNGYHLGQHRLLNGKAQLYEEDIRVPLLVRGPGIREDTKLDHLVLNIDMAPTIADLAGATPGHQPDGRSLAPLLMPGASPWRDRGRNPWRRDFVVEIYRAAGQIGEPCFALRTQDEIYAEFASGFREFYRLRQDPYQLANRASQLGPRDLNRFSRRLAEMLIRQGAACN